MAKKDNVVFYGTGRRKSSIARVRLVEGNGKITINGKDIDEFFGLETLKVIVRQPLTVTNTTSKFDVICSVKGGGFTGQAGAIRQRNMVLKKLEKLHNSQKDNYNTIFQNLGKSYRNPMLLQNKGFLLF